MEAACRLTRAALRPDGAPEARGSSIPAKGVMTQNAVFVAEEPAAEIVARVLPGTRSVENNLTLAPISGGSR
jgi:hypothetical protein